MIQHAQRVFAVVPGYPYELGQDLPSFSTLYSRLISLSDCILQLSPCRHTQLPRHLLHHPAAASLRGSSLCEATTGRPVTKIVSQCDGNLIVADQLQPPTFARITFCACVIVLVLLLSRPEDLYHDCQVKVVTFTAYFGKAAIEREPSQSSFLVGIFRFVFPLVWG